MRFIAAVGPPAGSCAVLALRALTLSAWLGCSIAAAADEPQCPSAAPPLTPEQLRVAQKDSRLYPKGLYQRARVNERMDWFNTQLSRDYCFGLVFAQLLPHHKRRSDEAQAGTVQWGQERSRVWLQVLNDHILGPGRTYVCGDAITIADYFGVGLLTLGEVIGCDFAAYPHVQGWLARMKALNSWKSVNAVLDGITASHKGEVFATV
jgi:glutathione S-transferase